MSVISTVSPNKQSPRHHSHCKYQDSKTLGPSKFYVRLKLHKWRDTTAGFRHLTFLPLPPPTTRSRRSSVSLLHHAPSTSAIAGIQMPTKVPITTRLLGRSMSGHAADAVSGQKVPPPSNESTSKQSSSEHVLVVDKSKELSVAPQQPSSIRRANSLPTHTTEGSAGNNNEHRAMSATAILSTSNAEVQAGETTHFSDHSDTDVCSPQTPSSPSTQLKKKKNKKKKKVCFIFFISPREISFSPTPV
jgi:hypothetical protein